MRRELLKVTEGRENIPGVLLLPIEVVAKEKDAVMSSEKEIADTTIPPRCTGEENQFEGVQKAGVCGCCLIFLGYVKN